MKKEGQVSVNNLKDATMEAVRFISINRSGVEKINGTVRQTETVTDRVEEGMLQQIQGIRNISGQNRKINIKKDEILKLLQHVARTAEDNSAATEELSATAREQSAALTEITSGISQSYDMVKELNAKSVPDLI